MFLKISFLKHKNKDNDSIDKIKSWYEFAGIPWPHKFPGGRGGVRNDSLTKIDSVHFYYTFPQNQSIISSQNNTKMCGHSTIHQKCPSLHVYFGLTVPNFLFLLF